MVGRPHGGPRGTIHDNQTGAALESSLDKTPELRAVTFEADALFIPGSDRRALLPPGRLRGVEFPVALFDAASPFVPSDDDADMVFQDPSPTLVLAPRCGLAGTSSAWPCRK